MPLILPSNSISALGYEVANSLRFEQSSSDYMTRTFGTPTSSQTWTLSFWIKRSKLSSTQFFFNTDGGNEEDRLHFDSSDRLIWFEQNSSAGTDADLTTNRVFRDVSAWYHIVIARDSTQATASNRIKIYVNGVQETSFATSTYPSLNDNSRWNTAVSHEIGARNAGTFVSAYLSEITFIDGQQLDPTSFGEFDEDTGIWKPIDVSGLTFGTNGFYLDFENSGSLGADVSGNGNNFTVNNLTSIDQTTDTPTNNYCTLNPLSTDSGVPLSNGNTESDYDATQGNAKGTIAFDSGKWYWEVKLTTSVSNYPMLGIGSVEEQPMQQPTYVNYPGGFTNSYGAYGNGNVYANGVNTGSQGFTWTTNDIIGIAVDLDSGTKTIKWYKNGSQIASYNITNVVAFASMDYNGAEGSVNLQYNFGNPAFSIASGNSDANGYGNFEYAVPSGYYALNTKNLSEFG